MKRKHRKTDDEFFRRPKPCTSLCWKHKMCIADKGLTDQDLRENFSGILLTGKQMYMKNFMQMWTLQLQEQTLDNLNWTENGWKPSSIAFYVISPLLLGQFDASTDNMKTFLTTTDSQMTETSFEWFWRNYRPLFLYRKQFERGLETVYRSSEHPPFDRRTFANLLQLAVKNVNFVCHKKRFCQVDGLAKGISFCVVLEKFWMHRK